MTLNTRLRKQWTTRNLSEKLEDGMIRIHGINGQQQTTTCDLMKQLDSRSVFIYHLQWWTAKHRDDRINEYVKWKNWVTNDWFQTYNNWGCKSGNI